MQIAIIFCETLRSEIHDLAERFPEVRCLKEMPWELHIHPDNLLTEVRREVEKLQDSVDCIVLGYGRCQSLDKLGNDFKIPLLRPEAEDCLGILLGQQRYEQELQRVPGTWFLSPGWTRMGTEFVFHELQLSRVGHKDRDPLALARRLLDGFSRALYINIDSLDDTENLRLKATKIACDLDLQLEETSGSLTMLENLIKQAINTHEGKN